MRRYNPLSQQTNKQRQNMRAALHHDLGRCPYGPPCNCFPAVENTVRLAMSEVANHMHAAHVARIGREYINLADLLGQLYDEPDHRAEADYVRSAGWPF